MRLRQLRDLVERRLDVAAARLVRDDVQHRAAFALLLDEARDRDVVRGETLRDVREHARAGRDLDAK